MEIVSDVGFKLHDTDLAVGEKITSESMNPRTRSQESTTNRSPLVFEGLTLELPWSSFRSLFDAFMCQFALSVDAIPVRPGDVLRSFYFAEECEVRLLVFGNSLLDCLSLFE